MDTNGGQDADVGPDGDGFGDGVSNPDGESDADEDIFDPPQAWQRLEGFSRSDILFEIDGRVVARTFSPTDSGMMYKEGAGGWRDISQLAYGEQLRSAKGAMFAETSFGDFLLVERGRSETTRTIYSNGGSGSSFSETTFSGLQQRVTDLAGLNGELFVVAGGALYRKASSAAGFVESAPIRLETEIDDVEAINGRLYIARDDQFPINERWAVSPNGRSSWTVHGTGNVWAPESPERWATVGDKVYAVNPETSGSSDPADFRLDVSGPGGSHDDPLISSPYRVVRGNLIGFNGELYGTAEGRLLRILPEEGRAEVVNDRPVGTLQALYSKGGEMLADADDGPVLSVRSPGGRWRAQKMRPAEATQKLVAGPEDVSTWLGQQLRYDMSEGKWHVATSDEVDEPFSTVMNVGGRWFGRLENSCLYGEAGTGWEPVIQWDASGIERGRCGSQPYANAVTVLTRGGGSYVAKFRSGGGRDARLVRWEPGSQTVDELQLEQQWSDGYDDVRTLAAVPGGLVASVCPVEAADSNFRDIRNSTCFVPWGDSRGREIRYNSRSSVGDGTVTLTSDLTLYGSDVYQTSDRQFRIGRWEPGETMGDQIVLSQRFELPATSWVTRQGPVVLDDGVIHRYDPGTETWSVLVDELPPGGGEVHDLTATDTRIIVSMTSGGVWSKYVGR
jgi:hypothetical protein